MASFCKSEWSLMWYLPLEFNVILTIPPEKSGKNTFFKSAETIQLEILFASPYVK